LLSLLQYAQKSYLKKNKLRQMINKKPP
jgi:hypothetical protein